MLDVAVSHRQGNFKLHAAFTIESGLTALIGPSGSGKTTLANIVAGLVRPDEGEIKFGATSWLDTGKGLWVPPHKRNIGYVFQEGRLFPQMTVRQNLTYARRFKKVPANEKRDADLIDLLGIRHLLDRRPDKLSGGEKSRVAIGRALFSAPDLLIMDEPLSALDPARKAEIFPHLEYIRDETGIPVLYVSHLMEEVARLATNVIAIENGKIIASGNPAEVLGSQATLPATIPAGSFLQARIEEIFADEGLMKANSAAGTLYLRMADAEVGDTVRVHIPATEITLTRQVPEQISALNRLSGRVETIRSEGGETEIIINCGGERILSRITSRSAEAMALQPGVEIFLLFKAVAIGRQGLFHRHG
ncbi:molybdenum ABC transporter ATP-binding protein [Rhizobium sp. L1K21]|uniref:molybdenum ABC transporter ATP-binding protein n=1 Tax=Rhizobium sp. L1K21 TaxID=2954933 RepID=UPI00209283D0|nr:molybdenum ABC transporter ATP-binding protein [Rhizobium sp. L1K21]MCO6186896.1 molybdenum ABC transporter ATP-binding protein [Rhizobium sp. L1K21]